jgi:hypothetical protein
VICDACYGWIPEHEVGGKMVRTRPHEIRSRGAGGEEIPENQLRLCQTCHMLYHTKGRETFIRMFPHLEGKIERALTRGR